MTVSHGSVAPLSEQVLRTAACLQHRCASSSTANRRTSGDGVEWAAYGLLFQLVNDGPQRSSALAETACVDPSTVSRQVAQLVKAGLVERQSDPEDGRASLLVATERGRARLRRQAGAPAADVRRVARGLVRRRRRRPDRPARPASTTASSSSARR